MFFNYFELLELSPDDSREENHQVLSNRLQEVNGRGNRKAILLHTLILQAQEVFEDEARYRDYRRELDAEQERLIQEGRSQANDELETLRRRLRNAEKAQRRQAKQEQTQRQPVPQQNAGSGSGWKGLLAELGRAAIQAYGDSRETRQTTDTPRPATPRLEAARLPSLSGVWVGGDGLPAQFTQRGSQLAFRAVNHFGVVVVEGTGVVDGYQAQLRFRYFDGVYYDEAQTTMQISADGRQLEGMVYYARAGVRPMRLVKRS